MASRPLTEEQILSRLPPYVKIDLSTYSGVNKKARFIDDQFGEWWTKPCKVFLGTRHPLRGAESMRSKRTLKLEEVIKRLPPHIKIIESTYKAYSKKATFIDIEYGEFTAQVGEVLKNKANHKKRVLAKKRKTCLERYGYEEPMKNPETIKKQRKTCLQKYGVESLLTTDRVRLLNANNTTSRGEKELKEYIESLGFKCKKIYIAGREIDIVVIGKEIAFEFNGMYWHSESKSKQIGQENIRNRHLDKTLLCKEKGLKLYQIFNFEWIYKKSQVKSRIRSILGVNIERVNGRQCQIRTVEPKTAANFIDSVHIQGATTRNSDFYIGLYFKDRLVAVGQFGKHHRGKDELILRRFCCADGVTVRGGLSKIVKHVFRLTQKPIHSWADLRWSDGSGYLSAGFKITSVLKPDYFYFKNNIVIPKQARMKKIVKTPDGMTEYEHALKDGLGRVWDCGKIKLTYDPVTHSSSSVINNTNP